MNFGNDEFFWRLKNGFYGPGNDEIHLALWKEVEEAARAGRKMFRYKEDYEDAVAAAQNRVFTFAIHVFLKEEEWESAAPDARCRWLRTVVKRAMTDEYRRQRPHQGRWIDAEPDENAETGPESAPAEKKKRHEGQIFVTNISMNGNADEETPALENTFAGDNGDFLSGIEFRQSLLERLGGIFTLDAGPEKLLIAAYFMLTSDFGHNQGGKGLNKAVAEKLSGCTVAVNYKRVKALMLKMEYPTGLMHPLRDRIKAGVDEKGQPLKDKIMFVDKELVTKYVNDVRTRNRREYAENGLRVVKEEEDDE